MYDDEHDAWGMIMIVMHMYAFNYSMRKIWKWQKLLAITEFLRHTINHSCNSLTDWNGFFTYISSCRMHDSTILLIHLFAWHTERSWPSLFEVTSFSLYRPTGTSKEMLHVYPMWPVWVCNFSHNQTELSISPWPISTYIILCTLTMELLVSVKNCKPPLFYSIFRNLMQAQKLCSTMHSTQRISNWFRFSV